MQQPPFRILLIDEEEALCQPLLDRLRQAGFDTCAVAGVLAGWDRIQAGAADAVVCAHDTPTLNGLALLHDMGRLKAPPPMVITAQRPSVGEAVQAIRDGAVDYLPYPPDLDHLERLFRDLSRQRAGASVRAVPPDATAATAKTAPSAPDGNGRRPYSERLIGASPVMQQLRSTLSRLARSDAPVLIMGESGVGKELAARALHHDGPRSATGQFIVLNCASIPGDLLESELFGHSRGAFTSASADRVGKFEAADGGTLFLDEIGDMPLNLQAKLLRALQEGEVTRVGENTPRHVDVRVVAATNQDLAEKMQEGAFRGDLYYRLAVVPLTLPPLRERPGDLPELAAHFFERCGLPHAEISAEALRLMEERRWPGNCRELENVIRRACALRPGLMILEKSDILALPDGPAEPTLARLPPRWKEGAFILPDEGIHFEALEAALLKAAWEKSGANQTRGAQLLGMSRQAFIYRLQKFGIIPGARNREGGAPSDAESSDGDGTRTTP